VNPWRVATGQISAIMSRNGAKLLPEGILMADLRITGVSKNQLELQAPDGSRHYLEITDDLLKALRNRDVSLPQNVTPREIQQMVRLGATVDEVVDQTGADQELVARFAKPIIAELDHIVGLARNIRLSLAGDRFAEPTLVEFGSVMDERLVNNGAGKIQWSAKKSLEGDWLVSVAFSTNDGEGIATWSFDPKQLFLSPENETALQLSNGVPISVTKTVPIIKEQIQTAEPKEEQHNHPTVMLSVVPEITETVADEPGSLPEPVDLFDEEAPPTNTLRVVEETTFEEISIIDTTFEVDEDAEPPVEESNQSSPDADSGTDNANRPQASSRWAEVLFGSRDDEEESN